mgnify:FL=1
MSVNNWLLSEMSYILVEYVMIFSLYKEEYIVILNHMVNYEIY